MEGRPSDNATVETTQTPNTVAHGSNPPMDTRVPGRKKTRYRPSAHCVGCREGTPVFPNSNSQGTATSVAAKKGQWRRSDRCPDGPLSPRDTTKATIAATPNARP